MATAYDEHERLAAEALRRGLVSREAYERCRRLAAQSAGDGRSKPSVLELLVTEGALEPKAVAALKRARIGGSGKRRAGKHKRQKAAGEALPEIPGFEVLELLGQGGMGSVYKARQRSLDRIVALKVLDPEVAQDERYLERFMTEARALARLNHENIIAGIDVGEANGYRYFAMEYVDGIALDRLLEREGPLAEKRALRIAMQIARALAHAHRHGMVHRDVKPQNIMIAASDTAKLCDLGLAMTPEEREEVSRRERGRALGTPHYVSPEQARGERVVDIRSDIYSLGATLYHALTGTTPFEGGSAMVLMTKHLTEEPMPPHRRRPELSRHVSALVMTMMAKARADRYQDPIELLEDMERVLHGKPPRRAQLPARTGASVAGRARRRRTTSTRRSAVTRVGGRRSATYRILLIAFALVIAAGTLAGVFVYRSYRRQLANERGAPSNPGAAEHVSPAASPEQRARAELERIEAAYEQAPENVRAFAAGLEALIARYPETEAAEAAARRLDELGDDTAQAEENAP